MSEMQRWWGSEPRLIRRYTEESGWLAVSGPGAPVSIGVVAWTAERAREDFARAAREWDGTPSALPDFRALYSDWLDYMLARTFSSAPRADQACIMFAEFAEKWCALRAGAHPAGEREAAP